MPTSQEIARVKGGKLSVTGSLENRRGDMPKPSES